ncbi:MAG: AAA family ATPase [Gammaproteobacteria bacterium]|nr:AAA family ATPase [Gammaproteobacteria bacterium]MDE0413425.1 AAA family ATPase [Gammaproteobacteria bacterium]
MKEIYNWVPWFTKLTQRIADGGPKYLSDCAKKVEWRHDQNLQGLLNYGDENIDPFSFFYTVASKGAHYASRKTTYPSISKVFDLPELADHDSEYTFIFPTPNPINLLFHYRGAGNPELLWRLFRQAANGVESIIDHDFDTALNMKSIAIVKLTQVLFLVNPNEFLPLDEKLHPLKITEWSKKPRWAEYRTTLAKFRQSFPRCAPYEINLFAWLVFDKELKLGAPKYFQIGTRTSWEAGTTSLHEDEVWEEFRSSNWVYTAPRDDEDRAIFADRLQEAEPGDVVLVRSGRNFGRGIGVVQKNAYRDDPNGRIHVLWLNTESARLPGNAHGYAFSRAGEKTLSAFRTAEEYAPTFELLERHRRDGRNGNGPPDERELTREAVLRAIEEFDKIGRSAFLRKYGRRGSNSYWIKHKGNHYDLKATWGAAHVHAGIAQPHRSLGTGQNSIQVKAQLERLGFAVVHKSSPNDRSVDHAKNLILFGPPGTGKTWKATRLALAIVRGVEFERVEGEQGAQQEAQRLRFNPENPDGRIEMVTFHQNYSYEDFVEGIRPRLKGEGIAYELRPGTFRRISDAAASDPDGRYVLIIDEINRGNIAKILGELITLIETSRRAGAEEATAVSLPYSGETFSVPGNLYIIGTMNTADRSIQLLDTALRRRFRFEELMPNPDHERVPENVEGVNCRKLMRAMNERITALLDREHQIGHTNFFDIKSMEELADRFQYKIFPLLQEYFFDDWGKIRRVLNNNAFVSQRKASNLPADEEQVEEERAIYERLSHDDEKWQDTGEYKAIYAGPNTSDR